MSDQPRAEVIHPKAMQVGGHQWIVPAPVLQIVVDGVYVGHADRTPGGCICYTTEGVPIEHRVAAQKAVEEHWGGVAPRSVAEVSAVQDEEDTELDE